MAAGNTDPVDHTMKGIDDNLGYDAFDPTSGENPAVVRNNHGGVWVQQVRLRCVFHGVAGSGGKVTFLESSQQALSV